MNQLSRGSCTLCDSTFHSYSNERLCRKWEGDCEVVGRVGREFDGVEKGRDCEAVGRDGGKGL